VEAGRECKGIVDLGKALERMGGREREREGGREGVWEKRDGEGVEKVRDRRK
jgi:hypothetical protein